MAAEPSLIRVTTVTKERTLKDKRIGERTVEHEGQGGVEHIKDGVRVLGDLLRDARRQRRISLRELARRSGVSAGQLSRIEAGEVEQPTIGTLTAIADAFGRPVEPLLIATGHLDSDEFWIRIEKFEETLGSFLPTDLNEIDDESAASQWWSWGDAEWMAAQVGGEAWKQRHEGLEEIALAWPALTAERKRLVLAFVADQEVLSTLDRMPSPPGRYELDVVLNKRASDDE
jgi:transcriptional regulator with XRE-family HTH domain